MQLLQTIRSQIKYKIILPYLLLMILVTMAGSGIALILVANSWQERFNNQLGQTARNFTGAMAQYEIENLAFLNRVAFTEANTSAQTPSVREAVQRNDVAGLARALKPLYQDGSTRGAVALDRLIVFDRSGKALVDWERNPADAAAPIESLGTDFSSVPQIQNVLQGKTDEVNGQVLDKFSALIKFQARDGQDRFFFFTVVPIRVGETIVGGALVATELDTLVQGLQQQSQSAITSLYDISGLTLATTATGIDKHTLDMPEDLVLRAANLNAQARAAFERATPVPATNPLPTFEDAQNDPCLDIGNQQGGLVNPLALSRLPNCSVKEQRLVGDREYEFVYAPLLIRGVQTGYFSISLSRDFIISAWSSSRWAVIAITAVLAIGAVLVGYRVAQQITHPLTDLVQTAEAVTQGDLERRSQVISQNELGRLAGAFNHMTEHLLRLYQVSRDLNQALEVRQVLEVTSNAAAAFVPGTEVLALLEESDGWHYHTRSTAPGPIKQLQNLILQPDDLLLQTLAQHQQARVWHAEEEPVLHTAGLLKAGIATALIAPVVMQERLVGVLIYGHNRPHAFNEADEQALGAMANTSATVLHNTVLYSRVQKDAQERQAILTSIGDGVIVCDEQGRIVLLNRVAEQMLGLRDWREQRYIFDELPLEPLDNAREIFGQTTTNPQYQLGALKVSRTDAPVIADDGRMIGEVIVLHDITAEAAVDQAKTDFIATISHELRTPLTVIRGCVDLLLRGVGGKPSTDQVELLEQARSRVNDMTGLINNAITIADLAVGKLTTELQPQDVWIAVERALSPLRPAFDNKGIEVRLPDLDTDLPPVLADREQLKIALGQLLDNAYRYTQSGSVTIRARVEQRFVRIDVEDTGQGITPDVLNRLFTPFQRVRGNESPQRGGGLGLAITRQLIERQGGQVQVRSTTGQGSVFSIILPQAHEHSLAIVQSNETTATSP